MILQRTPEWQSLRLGKVTASRVSDLMARTKTGWGASRANYAAELVIERLTGVPAPNFVSGPMAWGIAYEAEAAALYTRAPGCWSRPVGFVDHPEIAIERREARTDWSRPGLVRIKCPNSATHLATLLGGSIDGGHILQMQWQLSCTDRQWCDYVSYDPRLPPRMQLRPGGSTATSRASSNSNSRSPPSWTRSPARSRR